MAKTIYVTVDGMGTTPMWQKLGGGSKEVGSRDPELLDDVFQYDASE